MTRVQLALRVAIVSLPLALAVPRAAAPRFTLQEDWRIPASDNLRDIGFVRFAPNGRVIFAPAFNNEGEVVAYDTASRKPVWRLPLGWGQDKEVRGIQYMGFTGATMWVSDRSFHQVALIDPSGKVTKSLEHPSFVRPLLSERRKYPVFGSLDALAVYADGSWLVRPFREHDFVDTPEFDSSSVHLFRISESGVIQRVVAKYPEDPVAEYKEKNRDYRTPVFFANRALFSVSADGMRVAIVLATPTGKDSATYRVTMLNERGDTVFTRKLPYVPEKIPPTARDSALRRLGNVNNWGVAPIKAQMEKAMPATYMPVNEVSIGPDRSTWLKLRSAPSDSLTATHLVLDATGEPRALVTAPTSITLLTGDKNYVWGVERQKGNLRTVVRYKLVPAK